ncbi:hypothetical protein [Oryzomonas rubra]|nr:hypothetical protein [Oryzomonas rubra]
MANADEAMYIGTRTRKNRLTVFNGTMYENSFGKHDKGQAPP